MFQNTAKPVLKPDIFPHRIPVSQFNKWYLGYGQSQQHKKRAEKVSDEKKIQRSVVSKKIIGKYQGEEINRSDQEQA